MFVLEPESDFFYKQTLEAIHILKLFFDAGVDVVKHAKHYNLHVAGHYNTNGADLFELFEMLAPHALPNCTFLPSPSWSFSLSKDEDQIEMEKRAIVKEMAMSDFESPIFDYEDFKEFNFFIYKGDFSNVDLSLVQQAGYPFLNEFAEILDEERSNIYKNYYKMPDNPTIVETDDGTPCYICINKDKSKLAFMINMDYYAYQMYSIAAALVNAVKQVKMAEREDN